LAIIQEDNVDLKVDIKTEDDLLPPGAASGTVPSDLEQATGLERLEILGKMQGVDIFDMKPLDASRKGTCSRPLARNQTITHLYCFGCKGEFVEVNGWRGDTGTLDNPIIVKSFGEEQYAGCTGYPADSHVTIWLTVSPFRNALFNHMQRVKTKI